MVNRACPEGTFLSRSIIYLGEKRLQSGRDGRFQTAFRRLSLWSPGVSEAELAELNSLGTLEFDLDPMKTGAEPPTFDPNDAFYVPFNHFASMARPGPRIRIWKITNAPTEGSVGQGLKNTQNH